MEQKRKKIFLKYFTSLIVLITPFVIYSQSIEWNPPITAGYECLSGAVDSDNMLYFIGIAHANNGSIIFGDTTICQSNSDSTFLYLIKTDTSYNIEWIRKFYSSVHYWAIRAKLKIDNHDNLVITGNCQSKFIYDGVNLIEEDESVTFLTKLDKNGTIIWFNKIYCTNHSMSLSDMTFDSKNNIYIVGHYFTDGIQTLNFYHDNQLEYSTLLDGTNLIVKYNKDGNYSNSSTLNGLSNASIESVAADMFQNFYLTGWIAEDLYFGNDTLTPYRSDILLIKYDSLFNISWAKNIGSTYNDILESGYSIALDRKNENFYVTGSFVGEANFGNGMVNSDDNNIFLAKYSINGILKWVTTHGCWSGSASVVEAGRKLYIDEEDFVFLAGDLGQNSIIGDTVLTYAGSFLAKFYASGELHWG